MTNGVTSSSSMQTVILKVGLHCEGCERRVKKALWNVKGTTSVDVDNSRERVMVTGFIDPSKVLKAVKKTGKPVELWKYQNGSKNLYGSQPIATTATTTSSATAPAKASKGSKGSKGNNGNKNFQSGSKLNEQDRSFHPEPEYLSDASDDYENENDGKSGFFGAFKSAKNHKAEFYGNQKPQKNQKPDLYGDVKPQKNAKPDLYGDFKSPKGQKFDFYDDDDAKPHNKGSQKSSDYFGNFKSPKNQKADLYSDFKSPKNQKADVHSDFKPQKNHPKADFYGDFKPPKNQSFDPYSEFKSPKHQKSDFYSTTHKSPKEKKSNYKMESRAQEEFDHAASASDDESESSDVVRKSNVYDEEKASPYKPSYDGHHRDFKNTTSTYSNEHKSSGSTHNNNEHSKSPYTTSSGFNKSNSSQKKAKPQHAPKYVSFEDDYEPKYRGQSEGNHRSQERDYDRKFYTTEQSYYPSYTYAYHDRVPPTNSGFSTMFNEENANACSIM